MDKGVDFHYYRIDRAGEIVKFSVKDLKGITPIEFVNIKNSDISKFAILFKKEMEVVFTLSLEEAHNCSKYINLYK